MKTLKIHIGHFKTGTTAIQVFCSRHQQMLARQGVDYPALRHHNAKHSAFAFALYRAAGVEKLMHGYSDPIDPADLWRELFDHVRGSKHPVTLISSEEFMRVGSHPEAERRLREIVETQARDIRIEIIAYLRPPQAHLRSWFNQLVKMNQHVPDFNSALGGEIETVHYDYAAAIRPWSGIFGKDRVTIRRYPDRFEAPGDLIEDFMDAIDVRLPADVALPEGDPNPRLDDRIIDTLRLMQNLGLPRHMINTVRDQASDYVAAQDRFGRAGPPAVAAARAAAAAGIAALPGLAEASFDLAELGRALPEPEDPERVAERMMTGFVLAELLALRRRLNRMKLPELIERVERLEGRLGMGRDEAERADEDTVL